MQQRWFESLELASKGEDLDALTCQWQMAAGNYEKAIALARKKVADAPVEILPLALVSWIEFQHGGSEAAKESFEKVRALSSNADIESPPLHRLSWLANALKLEPNWRIPAKPADDIGQRPELDSWGPYRWHPYDIPEFTVKDLQNDDVSIRNIDRPTLVIFYLGFCCLHCVEQLKAFSQRAGEINRAGIDLMALGL